MNGRKRLKTQEGKEDKIKKKRLSDSIETREQKGKGLRTNNWKQSKTTVMSTWEKEKGRFEQFKTTEEGKKEGRKIISKSKTGCAAPGFAITARKETQSREHKTGKNKKKRVDPVKGDCRGIHTSKKLRSNQGNGKARERGRGEISLGEGQTPEQPSPTKRKQRNLVRMKTWFQGKRKKRKAGSKESSLREKKLKRTGGTDRSYETREFT